MEQLEEDLRAFFRRQATRLIQMAVGCTDEKTREELMKMAQHYLEKLGAPSTPDNRTNDTSRPLH